MHAKKKTGTRPALDRVSVLNDQSLVISSPSSGHPIAHPRGLGGIALFEQRGGYE